MVREIVYKNNKHNLNMRKYLFCSVFILILFSLTFSIAQIEEPRFYHEKSTNLTIYEKCRVEGAICNSSYDCSLSIISPSQSLIIDDVLMSGSGVFRSLLLLEDNQSINGLYEATVDCTDGTLSGSNTFYYIINPNGSQPIDFGQGLILFSAILLLIFFSTFIGYLGFRSTNTTIMLSFLSFAVILMVFTLGFILNIIELSFGTFSNIIDNYSVIYILFIVLIGVGAVCLIIYIIFVALNYYWQLRGMQDTLSVKEL